MAFTISSKLDVSSDVKFKAGQIFSNCFSWCSGSRASGTKYSANQERMVKLTESMILARTRVSDVEHVKKLNCWGAELSDISVLRKLRNVEVLSLRLVETVAGGI